MISRKQWKKALEEGTVSAIEQGLKDGHLLSKPFSMDSIRSPTLTQNPFFQQADVIYPLELCVHSHNPKAVHFLLDSKASLQSRTLGWREEQFRMGKSNPEMAVGAMDALLTLSPHRIYDEGTEQEWVKIAKRFSNRGLHLVEESGWGRSTLLDAAVQPAVLTFLLDDYYTPHFINEADATGFTLIEILRTRWDIFFHPLPNPNSSHPLWQLPTKTDALERFALDFHQALFKAFERGMKPPRNLAVYEAWRDEAWVHFERYRLNQLPEALNHKTTPRL